MLKIHSFLQRIKQPVLKLLPDSIGRYKTYIGVLAYVLATVLFLLSPDYLYDTKQNKPDSYAKAETISPTPGETAEETANEAVIRTSQNNKQAGKLMAPGEINYSTADAKANSVQTGAAAALMVDSGSTEEKGKTDTKETGKKTSDGTVKETESKTSKGTEGKKDTGKKKESKKTKTEDRKKRVIDLSDSDIEILQRIVEAEATGESTKGKILVANVILNRVKDDKFPDTVKGVVFQKDGNTYQFSPIKDNRYWSVTISKDTVTAVERALQGEDYSQGALYFSARSRADKNSMSWFDRNLKFLFKYGEHEFFK